MRGRIEREIRLLPPVLACSVEDDIVALIAPDADPEQVAVAIEAVVRGAGADLPVRVVGGMRPSRPPFILRFRSRPAKVGLVASGAAALLASVFVGVRAPEPPPSLEPPAGGSPASGAAMVREPGVGEAGEPAMPRILVIGGLGAGAGVVVADPRLPSGAVAAAAGQDIASAGEESQPGGSRSVSGGRGRGRRAGAPTAGGGDCRTHEHEHGGHAGGRGHGGWSTGRGHDGGHGQHLGHGCDD